MPNTSPVLSASKLTKSFGADKALNRLELDINAGEVTAILGSNGAGKTTFIRCALGLTRASAGTLSLFGHKPGALAVRRRIGAMLQASDLPDLLTVREHITLVSSYYANPLPVDNLLRLSQLHGFADKRYKTLSGGQKRQVQFALAVVGNPELIFLDEPTTGLDTDARHRLWERVRSLTSAGAAVVLTTHYLEEADALADRIVLLQNGRVVADGTPQEIRNFTSGQLIRCVTELPLSILAELPDVVQARQSGRFVELTTHSAPASLKGLLELDANPADLTVTKPTLDDAMRSFIDTEEETV